jgi:hypothetical protein
MANVKISGAAEGIIMATIISAHMKNSAGNVRASHGFVSGAIMQQQQDMPGLMPRASRVIHAHASAVSMASAARTIHRSLLRITSTRAINFRI